MRVGLYAGVVAISGFVFVGGSGCGGDGGGSSLGGKGGSAGSGTEPADGGDAGGKGGTGGRASQNGGRAGTGGSAGGAGGGSTSDGGARVTVDASTDDAGPGNDAGDASADAGSTTTPEWPFVFPANGVCTVSGFCWAAPTPLGNSLEGIWGSGANDVWFAGHVDGGTLAHWDGTSVRGLTALTEEWGNVVTGTAATDVWVLGGPHALHYDGKDWTRLAPGTDKPLRAAHAVDAKLAYAVGDAGTLVKWDGKHWEPFVSGTTDALGAVWAFADDDVWIAGTNAYHWNGTGWSSAPACVAFWGTAPNDLFCVRAGIALAHYNGTKWTDIAPIPETPVRALWGSGPKDVMVLTKGATYRYNGTTFALAAASGGVSYSDSYPTEVGLWAASATEYWAAGPRVDTAPGSLFHLKGAAPWTAFGENLAADGVACAHQGTAFVGTGVAWTATSNPDGVSTLARWNGTDYTPYPPGTDKPLLAIDALSAVDVWVTAAGGDVTHWDGTSFTAGNVGANTDLTALYAASPTSVWAGGGAGSIFEYDGMNWADRSVKKMSALAQLWATAPDDVWAVGDTTYHYTKDWKAVDLPTDWPRLVAVWGNDPKDLRGVALSATAPDSCVDTCGPSCDAAVLAWDGITWTLRATGAPACGDTAQPVFKSFSASKTEAWATDGRNSFHWDDAKWTREPLPTDPHDLACGVASDGQQVLVTGPYPIMRRKSVL
jgi:hypothetical protein